ncbi:MAG: hypothetical protein ACYCV0_06725 [Desulfitobacteriaceae bacterium]
MRSSRRVKVQPNEGSGWGEPDAIVPKAQEKQSVIRDRMYEGWGYLTEGLRDKLDKDDK